ncbi:MAG: hypothetical protein AB2A00_19305 [Myxococcota bacterium]
MAMPLRMLLWMVVVLVPGGTLLLPVALATHRRKPATLPPPAQAA